MSSQDKNDKDVKDSKNSIRQEAMECVESGRFRQTLERGYVSSEVISYLGDAGARGSNGLQGG